MPKYVLFGDGREVVGFEVGLTAGPEKGSRYWVGTGVAWSDVGGILWVGGTCVGKQGVEENLVADFRRDVPIEKGGSILRMDALQASVKWFLGDVLGLYLKGLDVSF